VPRPVEPAQRTIPSRSSAKTTIRISLVRVMVSYAKNFRPRTSAHDIQYMSIVLQEMHDIEAEWRSNVRVAFLATNYPSWIIENDFPVLRSSGPDDTHSLQKRPCPSGSRVTGPKNRDAQRATAAIERLDRNSLDSIVSGFPRPFVPTVRGSGTDNIRKFRYCQSAGCTLMVNNRSGL